MRLLRAFLGFLYEFVVGDDPTIAVVVVAALGVTAAMATRGISGWWVMPCAVIGVLGLSLRRATH
jgi:predicted branched-subunit amino acid permease